MRRSARLVLAAIVVVLAAGTIAGLEITAQRRGPTGDRSDPTSSSPAEGQAVTAPSTTTTIATTTTPPVSLVPWTGPVEHIFFHTLIADPALAFTHDQLARGFLDYFVTVGEFKAILDQLYANGWTLVDIHRVSDGTVLVPAGRRPLVISEDDVNYYDYERPRGLGWRLVLDGDGT